MRRRAALIAVSVVLVAGCSANAVVGSPAEKALTKPDLYNPCTLPVESLRALGLDPKPVDTDFFGVADPEWHACLWKASSFYLTVLSTTHTFREVKENPRNEELRSLTVAGRDAVTYFDVSDPSRFECDVAFATDAGVVVVRAAIEPKGQDPCVVAQQSTVSLNKDFPG